MSGWEVPAVIFLRPPQEFSVAIRSPGLVHMENRCQSRHECPAAG
jgi:hypothetical protein